MCVCVCVHVCVRARSFFSICRASKGVHTPVFLPRGVLRAFAPPPPPPHFRNAFFALSSPIVSPPLLSSAPHGTARHHDQREAIKKSHHATALQNKIALEADKMKKEMAKNARKTTKGERKR